MSKQKIFNTVMIILIILSFTTSIFAEENQTANGTTNEAENNSVRALTLQEQRNQVQEQLTTASDQLTYVQGELSSKMINIQNLQDKISNYQKQLDEVNSKYDELQQQVKESEKSLSAIQSKYIKKDRLLKERLVEIYKRGTNNYLDVLLGSKDIIEFISNYFMIESITKYDMQSLDQLNEQKQKIEKLANELNEKKVKMKLTKNNAETQSVILANTKTILENEKASLDDSEQHLLSQIDSYKKQQDEINNLISASISSSTYELFYSGGEMVWPTYTSAYITSPFGSRLHPIQGIVKNHAGIDIGASMGSPVYAATDGVIIYYSWMGGYGNTVMIDHGTNDEGIKIVTLYGHGSAFIPELGVGSQVTKGQEIMKVGSTGNSTGPHVHFEVRENGVAVDPKKYLSSSH
ncbi:MAG: peptidoglycan DD-metalloendopeptidase family protein [Clostridia bacterium]|nr:peptidoglycan DD-metalloendopeptidase family protein [Clostridia bacterium]